MHNFFLVTLIFFFTSLAYGQNISLNTGKETFGRNAVYGNLGFLLLYGAASAYYERTVTVKRKSWEVIRAGKTVTKNGRFATTAKVGYGAYGAYASGQGPFVTGQLGFILGANSAHFEFSGGVAYFLDDYILNQLSPAINMGVRRQDPGDLLFWRAGLSYPESLYFGIGISL